MKIKVLESFAYGTPVVSNADGFEGLDGIDGRHYLQADSDAALVDATVSLLRDPARRGAMRIDARALLDDKYSARPAVDRLFAAWRTQHGPVVCDTFEGVAA